MSALSTTHSPTTMTKDLHTVELELPTDFANRLRELDDNGIDGAIAAGLKLYVALGKDYQEKLARIRSAEGLSTSAATKRALDFYIENAHMHSPEDIRTRLRRTGNKEERITRDARIVELADKGLTRAGIAVEVGLSAIRVSQILAYERAKRATPSDTENT